MPNDHIGQGRIFLLGHFFETVDIPYQHRSRILLAEIAVAFFLSHAFAMSQMVISRDHAALVGQKPGKLLVSLHILRHAVDDLHHTQGFTPFRHISDRVNPGLIVPGIKIELFFFHLYLCLYMTGCPANAARRQGSPSLYNGNRCMALEPCIYYTTYFQIF